MAIIGTDDRIPVPDEWLTHTPCSAIVLVISKFPDGTWTSGSGAMIGPDDVLTAAHCIYSDDYGGWANNVYVAPAYSPRGLTFDLSQSENLWSVNGWTQSEDLNWDYGYIDLETNIGFETGWFEIESKGTVGTFLESFGYPGDAPYDSEQMVYTCGTVDAISGNVFYFNDDFDLWYGQSGSAVLNVDDDGYIDIVGIVSHHINFPTKNGVLRLSDDMVTQINGWADASISNPSDLPPP